MVEISFKLRAETNFIKQSFSLIILYSIKLMDNTNGLMETPALDIYTILTRLIKYLIEGGAVALAAYFIPRRPMELPDIAKLAVTAAAVFAILDLFAPTIALSARQGTGFGIGATQVGFTVPVL